MAIQYNLLSTPRMEKPSPAWSVYAPLKKPEEADGITFYTGTSGRSPGQKIAGSVLHKGRKGSTEIDTEKN